MWTNSLARRSLLVACFLLAVTAVAVLSGPAVAAPDPYAATPAVNDGSGYGAGDPGEAHAALFRATRFPTAQACRTCHPEHYREWSVSQHAYAQLSPIFNAMQASITKQTSGTNGDFCIRCHTQPGMILGEPVHMTNMDRSPIAREGVTCIVCHRVNEEYGKVSGRLALVEGGLEVPIKGPTGNAELQRVLKASDTYPGMVTAPDGKGRLVHGDVVKFFALESPGFCGSCHDVTLPNGFRLEEAFSEYKTSPAAREGTTCQDCHMSFTPGTPKDFRHAPAALVGGVETRPRKRTNHMWVGPDYSVIHAGLFPHNPDAEKLATMREWTTFDDAAGWGTPAFEDKVAADMVFPERWRAAEVRYDARDILDKQKVLLAEATRQRRILLSKGYELGTTEVERADERGLKLKVEVKNGGAGHNVPTGFTAERIVFLRVTMTDSEGTVVYRSGDFDPNGDLRDSHSAYVRSGELPLDPDLFSLQSKFITTNVRGGEREQVLAVNYSLDPLPFVRPEPFSTILLGRNRGARIHKRGIEPEGQRFATFEVKPKALTGKAPYTAKVELISGMVPVNLVREVQDVGFDYFMSPKLVAEKLLDGYMVLHDREVPMVTAVEQARLERERAREQAERATAEAAPKPVSAEAANGPQALLLGSPAR